jgi:hypothetical protein
MAFAAKIIWYSFLFLRTKDTFLFESSFGVQGIYEFFAFFQTVFKANVGYRSVRIFRALILNSLLFHTGSGYG